MTWLIFFLCSPRKGNILKEKTTKFSSFIRQFEIKSQAKAGHEGRRRIHSEMWQEEVTSGSRFWTAITFWRVR